MPPDPVAVPLLPASPELPAGGWPHHPRLRPLRLLLPELGQTRPAQEPASRIPWSLELQTGALLLVVACCLTVLEYLGSSNQTPAAYKALLGSLRELLRSSPLPSLAQVLTPRLVGLSWWSLSCTVCYLVLPGLFVRFVLRRPLAEMGLSPAGMHRHLPLYLLLYLVVLPAVIVVSYQPAFQHTYPFFKDAWRSWPHLLAWELIYAAQFFSLEFFFRGVLVQGLRPRLGWMSVPVMVVPYCMIHFGKPMPEALGAIVAGTVLGLLAYLTRSIWCGFLVHVSVAWTMDLLSLGQKGQLGRLW